MSVNVNPNAPDYVYGIVAYGWTGEPSVSGDTIGCTWTGATPLPLLATPLLFGSNKNLLMGWIVENPSSGTVVASHSGIGTGLDTRSRFITVGVWSQAQPLDLPNIQAAVVSAVGSTNVATSGVTVPSILPASRVITAHLVGKGKKINDFTGTRVASAPSPSGNGQLLLGETRGAASVNPTITHNTSTQLWGAFGLNTDPAPLAFGAAGRHKAGSGSWGGSVYRFAEPHPDRYYEVPRIGSSTILAGNFVRSTDGVAMPVWVKDPDDTNDYTLDWSNHLADDDRITHVEHTVSGSLRRFSQALDETGHMTQVWINGGTVNVTRSVRVRASTARGRRFDRTFWIAGTQN
ncbi:hypothetical protein BST17_08535 [Mycolicibacterium bacteremicum]|uniref:Minor tail protein n=1 Tax=Mycolicibacterium bacteremicum TaxID=564198 RepID=A0A1W9Z0I0_MYCBA|nr:hypothetical protein BST17_08535 [Mycolicibacterium bacteremicum]